MRVLFDAHHVGRKQTGNETYARELVRALGRREDVEVVAAVDRPRLAEAASLGVRLAPMSPNPWLRLATLGAIARRAGASILHSIYYLPPAARVPTVVTIHDVSYERFPEFFGRQEVYKNRWLVRSAARRAGLVVTVSEHARGELVSLYGVDPERVAVVSNGVSDAFRRGERPPAAPIGTRPLRILGVGTLQPRKNLLRLAEAVRVVGEQRPVRLRLVGPDGFQAQEIRERVAASAEVDVLGYLSEDELAREYRDADVFAYPSIYEGFGLPVVEAMASGTPVVTSTGGSLPEVAGDAALLVDPYDVAGLAAAILSLAADDPLRESLRAKGLERAELFTWERSAEALASAYRGLVTRGSPSGSS